MPNESPKTAKKTPAAKVFDVTRPGKSPADATARPVIVGHKPQVHDPLLSASAGASSDDARPLLTRAKKKTAITPITPAETAKTAPPLTASAALSAPPAATGQPISAPPDEQPAMDLGDVAVSSLAGPSPEPSVEMNTESLPMPTKEAPSIEATPTPSGQTPQPADTSQPQSNTATAQPEDAQPPQTPQAPSLVAPAETPATSVQANEAKPNPSSLSAPAMPKSTTTDLDTEELDLSQVSKPTAIVGPTVSQPEEAGTDDELLAGMSAASLIEPNSVVVSHHKRPRGFKKRLGQGPSRAQPPLLPAHASPARRRAFPWLGLLLAACVLLVLAIVVLDLLLDGGFITNTFHGHTIPHTHFFKN